MNASSRSQSLDIIRCTACFLIIAFHGFIQGHHVFAREFAKFFQNGGWIGIDLFFVLSGFLISGLLFREQQTHGTISYRHFFIRRGFKIYPPFYSLVIITMVLAVWKGIPFAFNRILPWLVYLQDYIQPAVSEFIHASFKGGYINYISIPHLDKLAFYWRQTWTLAVEEKFYLLLPILLIALIRLNRSNPRPFRRIPQIFAVIAVACLAFRTAAVLMLYPKETGELIWIKPFHARVDALFFGVLISYFYHYHSTRFRGLIARYQNWFLAAGVALILPIFFPDVWPERMRGYVLYTLGYTAMYFASGLILIGSVDRQYNRNVFANALAYCGRHSYSIYLWHRAIQIWIQEAGWESMAQGSGLEWLGYTVIAVAATFGGGILMSLLIDAPMLRIRDRFFPSRAAGSAAPAERHLQPAASQAPV